MLLIATFAACSVEPKPRPVAEAKQAPAGEKSVDPMASFTCLVGGQWKQTVKSGTSMFETWRWGPGGESLRGMTDGLGAAGEPWREVQVLYWHPGHKQVRVLGLSPYEGGIAEGSIVFDGNLGESAFELHQLRGPRTLRSRWTFDGPDMYRAELLEATGSGAYAPLAAWDRFRVPATATGSASDPTTPDAAPFLPQKLHVFEPVIGYTWQGSEGREPSTCDDERGGAIRSVVEWVPYCDGVYVRVEALAADEERSGAHLLDVYLYHHTGTGDLRCLALSHQGGVYEGSIAVLNGGALQAGLTGYQRGRVVPMIVRMDFEMGGAVRTRVWSVTGAERTPEYDFSHRKHEQK